MAALASPVRSRRRRRLPGHEPSGVAAALATAAAVGAAWGKEQGFVAAPEGKVLSPRPSSRTPRQLQPRPRPQALPSLATGSHVGAAAAAVAAAVSCGAGAGAREGAVAESTAKPKPQPPPQPPATPVAKALLTSTSVLVPPDVDLELLGLAAAVGVLTGLAVAAFKLSIAAIVSVTYASEDAAAAAAGVPPSPIGWSYLAPAAGGLVVVALRSVVGGSFGPSLAGHVAEVEAGAFPRLWPSLARTAAAVATLGTGSSLGPEGPSVELGVIISRFMGGEFASARRRRQLLAAGAAAGVAAGFNAPLAGVFFALEIVPEAVASAVQANSDGGFVGRAAEEDLQRRREAELDVKSRPALAAVVVCALVAAAVIQEILGSEGALRPVTVPLDALRSPLVQLPLYIGLGALCGVAAAAFERATAAARLLFSAEGLLGFTPSLLRPAIGGLVCGGIGVYFPQVLFFGYSTLNAILAAGANVDAEGTSGLASEVLGGPWQLLALLGAKLAATSLCLGSGLVGGTFAPSLFLGAVLGAAYQSVIGHGLAAVAEAFANLQLSLGVVPGSWGILPQLTVANTPAYATVGAAAVLASVFRAPLTASLLLFELTRGYDLVLPLLAASGIAPLVANQLSGRLDASRKAVALPVLVAIIPSSEDLLDGCDVDNKIVCDAEAAERSRASDP